MVNAGVYREADLNQTIKNACIIISCGLSAECMQKINP